MNLRRWIRGALVLQGLTGALLLVVLSSAFETMEPPVVGLVLGLFALLFASTAAALFLTRRRDRALGQLRRALAFAVRRDAPRPEAPPDDPEVALLVKLAAESRDARRVAEIKQDARFGAAIGALSSGVVLLSPSGQISLINGKAKAMLGAERATVGASVFSILDRDDLGAAIAHAEAAGRLFHAQISRVDGGALDLEVAALGGDHGTLLTLEGEIAEWLPGCEHALDLHDRAPHRPPPSELTALDELPVTVLDTETTGLDVVKDKIVQFAALKMEGERIYPADSVERIVDPERPIPAVSAAVHGITDEIARAAKPLMTQWDALMPFIEGRVLVGHNIGFDAALLRRAAHALGKPWPEPRRLCTARLAEALDPEEHDFNLETVAARLGIETIGRHTAMGDVLVTAEVFRRQLVLLRARDLKTLGEVERFAQNATRMTAAQTESGW